MLHSTCSVREDNREENTQTIDSRVLEVYWNYSTLYLETGQLCT